MAQDTIDMRTNNGAWTRLLSWLSGGRLVSPDSGDITGPTSAHGKVGNSEVTDRRAMQIATVWDCVRLLSTMVASVPLDFHQYTSDGRPKPLDGYHNVAKLFLYQPNEWMTWYEFRRAMTVNLVLFGNAYAFKEKNGVGDTVGLMPIQAPNVRVFRSEDGNRVYYRVSRSNGQYLDYSSDDILHLKGLSTDGLVGLSPIENARRTLGIAIAIEDQQQDFYANGAKTPKILKTGDGKILSKEQRAQVEANFAEIAAGPVDKRLWILEAGFDTDNVTLSAQDAQTIQSRDFQVSEIARIFGVPPHLLGQTDKSTSWGSGIEQQNLMFIQTTLVDYYKSWESAIELRLLKPSERRGDNRVVVEHNLDFLLRGDQQTRANFLSTMTKNGIYTINEARAKEKLKAVDGGDEPLVQMQNIPLNLAGQVTSTHSGQGTNNGNDNEDANASS